MDKQTDDRDEETDRQEMERQIDNIDGEFDNRDRQTDKQTVMEKQNRTKFRFFQLPIIESGKNKFDRFFLRFFEEKKFQSFALFNHSSFFGFYLVLGIFRVFLK